MSRFFRAIGEPVSGWLLWIPVLCLCSFFGRDTYDYFTWTWPMNQCAAQAQRADDGVAICRIHGSQVTIYARRP